MSEDYHYTSARHAWHDCFMKADRTPGDGKLMDPTVASLNWFTQRAARTITAKATQPRGNGRLVNIEESFELAKVKAAIDRMPALLRAWGMFAYAQPTREQYELVAQTVYKWWYERNGHEFMGNYRKTLRHIILVHDCMEDMAHRFCTGRAKYLPVELSFHLGTNKNHWARDWADRYAAMQDYVDGIDRRALGPVARVLAECEQNAEAEGA